MSEASQPLPPLVTKSGPVLQLLRGGLNRLSADLSRRVGHRRTAGTTLLGRAGRGEIFGQYTEAATIPGLASA